MLIECTYVCGEDLLSLYVCLSKYELWLTIVELGKQQAWQKARTQKAAQGTEICET